MRSFWWKKFGGTSLPWGRVSRQSQRVKEWMQPGNIKITILKQWVLLSMVLNLSAYVNGSQLAKNENVYSLQVTAIKIYWKEAVSLKSSNYTLKNNYFCEYIKLGAISWKFDILSKTAWLKFASKKSFCTYVTHIIVIICWKTTFRFYLIGFQLNTDWNPFPIAVFIFYLKIK